MNGTSRSSVTASQGAVIDSLPSPANAGTATEERARKSASRTCKHCDSSDLVRIGTPGGVQRFRCRSCRHTFMDTGAMPGMRVDATSIGAALAMYYAGFTLREIRCRLNRVFEIEPSISTVHDWIRRYTNVAIDLTRNVVPRPSDTWVVLESTPESTGERLACVDLFDHDSGFLLGFQISAASEPISADALLDHVRATTGVWPRLILRPEVCGDAAEATAREPGFDLAPLDCCEVIADPTTNAISRFRSATAARARVLRGLSRSNGISHAASGWWVHHNFIRRFGITGFTTPATLAGLDAPFRHWADVVHIAPPRSTGHRAPAARRPQAFFSSPMTEAVLIRQSA